MYFHAVYCNWSLRQSVFVCLFVDDVPVADCLWVYIVIIGIYCCQYTETFSCQLPTKWYLYISARCKQSHWCALPLWSAHCCDQCVIPFSWCWPFLTDRSLLLMAKCVSEIQRYETRLHLMKRFAHNCHLPNCQYTVPDGVYGQQRNAVLYYF